MDFFQVFHLEICALLPILTINQVHSSSCISWESLFGVTHIIAFSHLDFLMGFIPESVKGWGIKSTGNKSVGDTTSNQKLSCNVQAKCATTHGDSLLYNPCFLGSMAVTSGQRCWMHFHT